MPLFESLQHIGSLDELVLRGGYLLLFLLVFAETGLFAGFFLPGDSLLITAGLIAASGRLDLLSVMATLVSGAVLGDLTGWLIGRHIGRRLFLKSDSRFFHREHLEKTETFYRRHGPKAVFLARFIPIVRSFAATLAGVTGMPASRLLFFSMAGSTVWVGFFTLVGYSLASLFPELVAWIHAVIAVGIVLIILSALRHLVPAGRGPSKKPEAENTP
ncbi:DedA family protein [Chlorobium sp. N1]|uniref:DedA family protein n=1 Tax=Chlorobium sp. N1 TaxID=2491138 RepID=UPI00103FAF1F|nr:DedA family protein [Chlorobium sp. N1]TCD47090.1 DedA family protein [Chlorobium sp. N1]